jgi:hypothetical protein
VFLPDVILLDIASILPGVFTITPSLFASSTAPLSLYISSNNNPL